MINSNFLLLWGENALFCQEKNQFEVKVHCLRRETSYNKKAKQTRFFKLFKQGTYQLGKSD